MSNHQPPRNPTMKAPFWPGPAFIASGSAGLLSMMTKPGFAIVFGVLVFAGLMAVEMQANLFSRRRRDGLLAARGKTNVGWSAAGRPAGIQLRTQPPRGDSFEIAPPTGKR